MSGPRPLTLSEGVFLRAILLALGQRPDLRVWRQNVGTLALEDASGRVRAFRAGPPKGAADLSGIVQPEGWRVELEVKSARGRRSPAQLQWERFIRTSGGVYLCATYDAGRSLEDNVRLAVQALDAAITARRTRP